jgi:formylglycine-generating enzyme required for sulfatase activity
MGKCEVTWNEFELFMYPTEEKRIRASHKVSDKLNDLTDASSRPTQPYVEMSFGMGKDGFPAISMTQHSANKYCEWLSAKTGHFYRLPTEAEWEYAARAGTTTAYFWGDDASQMDDYCWWANNSEGKYQKVGRKKPNPWGLHDILGNVIEWTLDQYSPTAYASGAASNPWVKATKPYPHSARGGSWDDDSAEKLRVAARRFSDPDWKIQDPQFPKSIWYHTDAQFLGFRVVRPLKTPSAEEMQKAWNSGVEMD